MPKKGEINSYTKTVPSPMEAYMVVKKRLENLDIMENEINNQKVGPKQYHDLKRNEEKTNVERKEISASSIGLLEQADNPMDSGSINGLGVLVLRENPLSLVPDIMCGKDTELESLV